MMNSLDLLVIVFMALAALSLLAVSLMFLARNHRVKKVCFYVAAVLGIYVASISVRMFWPMFFCQFAVGIALGVVSIAALVLERLSKENEKRRSIAHVMAAVSLVVGMVNVFV